MSNNPADTQAVRSYLITPRWFQKLRTATGLSGLETVYAVQDGEDVQVPLALIPLIDAVESVSLAMPNIFSVAGSPVIPGGSTGFAVALVPQAINTVLAGPSSGTAQVPAFRPLVSADFPTIGVAQGGTGATTTAGALVSLGIGQAATFDVVPVANGGTGETAAGGAALDNISGFATTGFLYRNSAASYAIISAPIPQPSGGTGLTTLTAHKLVVGGAGNAMTAIATGVSGQPLLSGGATTDPFYGVLSIAAGGTGVGTAPLALTALGAAALAGSSSQVFNVSNASAAANALAYQQSLTAGAFAVVTGSRAFGTTYTNSTGRPIFVYAVGNTGSVASAALEAFIGGVAVGFGTTATGATSTSVAVGFIVPAGATYEVTATNATINSWTEIR
jgi:hypothetical protein